MSAFDATTGELISSFAVTNVIGTAAVSSGEATVYEPTETNKGYSLELLSGSTGKVISAIPGVSAGPLKTILSPNGAYAFVMSHDTISPRNGTAIINLAKAEVVGYMTITNGAPVDIAISPNGKQFFISTKSLKDDFTKQAEPEGVDQRSKTSPVFPCTQVPGICVFDTSTFAVTGTVATSSAGFLAVSQDSKTLYTWPWGGVLTPLSIVDTASLIISPAQLPSGYNVFGIAVAPSGNQAVIEGGVSSTTFYLLDTVTNTITGTFPPPPIVNYLELSSSSTAFSPDGTSLWTLTGCDDGCSTLVGQTFPSGNVIAQTSLSSAPALALTF